MSWGDFIIRLVEAWRGHDPEKADRIRMLVWAAANLDRMAQAIGNDMETGYKVPLEERLNRLGGAAAILAELAQLRSSIEEALHASG